MAKVLIVDDSGFSRRILRRILEGAGHEVIEADNGMAALETYFVNKPDLVMLDLTMDGMYGLEVLERIKALDSAARIIIASADIQELTRQMALKAGAAAVVNKPFTPDKVMTVVSEVLGR
ncbi:response regulator receiver protein [Thermosinus carboxydivorans Nor1]|uniref:Response regulator receiver protein n=1 Tax=Thermosinus carboxydivorans Nor1 TaxID=401526 RepID=A1HSJ5_9FIRM|nr:response regulator [Thermosinus carboxydivorans]EAX46967.1 response regulator receiver protein [Thermosinus carboxydivorans Nor1]